MRDRPEADEEIRQLFAESRRADLGQVPRFHGLRPRATERRRARPFVVLGLLGAGAVAIALAIVAVPELGRKAPAPEVAPLVAVKIHPAAPSPAPVVVVAPETPLPEAPKAPAVEQAVVAAEDLVARLDPTQATRFSESWVSDLPVPPRVHQNVITLAPGVQDADGDGNPNVHTFRSREIQAMDSVPEEFQERVKVRAESVVVDLDSTSQSTRFSENAVSDLPVPGRFYENVVGGVAGGVVGGVLGGIVSDEEPGVAPAPAFNTESYDPIDENPFLTVVENPLSTFSIDVDTASYSNVRRFLTEGQLPPPDAVRIEELINYFSYDDPGPTGDAPFGVTVEVAGCPWNDAHRLARIGIKGRKGDRGSGSNLVFLIDVSGSMEPKNKLPLLKKALRLLVEQLDGGDRVAIVVYAGSSGLVLPSTSGDDKTAILGALGRLESGGSTNGAAGLALAYQVARENFIDGGINRVVLATDGDFNVGVTSRGELLQLIEDDAKHGVFLTALGFGMGNYKDATLETLADRGNGNYAYIDTLSEARKVLVEEIDATLVTIAKDVKIQVEFNPLRVGAYRLIGYENRMLRKEDFNDDRKDAGEIGAGHSLTVLYELVPPGAAEPQRSVDPLRYQSPVATTEAAESGEAFTLNLRYKEPDGDTSRLLSFPVTDDGGGFAGASADFKFASAVAAFGLVLRDSPERGRADLDLARRLADEGRGRDTWGYRGEFVDLVGRAAALAPATQEPRLE